MVARRQHQLVQWLTREDRGVMLGLVLLTVVGALAMFASPRYITAVVLMVPLFLGSLTLAPRRIRALVVLILVTLAVESAAEVLRNNDGFTPGRRLVSSSVIVLLSTVMLVVAYRRERLGGAGARGGAGLLGLPAGGPRQRGGPAPPPGRDGDGGDRAAGGATV